MTIISSINNEYFVDFNIVELNKYRYYSVNKAIFTRIPGRDRKWFAIFPHDRHTFLIQNNLRLSFTMRKLISNKNFEYLSAPLGADKYIQSWFSLIVKYADYIIYYMKFLHIILNSLKLYSKIIHIRIRGQEV